jgi:hypothetical protein
MWPHATADIEQENEVEGEIFTAEIDNVAHLTAIAELEFLPTQAADDLSRGTKDLNVDANERDVRLENYRFILLLCAEWREAQRQSSQSGNGTDCAAHSPITTRPEGSKFLSLEIVKGWLRFR